jgi:hypothetical protein
MQTTVANITVALNFANEKYYTIIAQYIAYSVITSNHEYNKPYQVLLKERSTMAVDAILMRSFGA